MNMPVVQQQTAVSITAADTKSVVEQVKAIQHIMQAVMKDGTHYGVIPGCKQPSLYKPGSEALLSAFKISVEPEVKTIRDGDHISYEVRCIGRHMQSGIVIGIGVGEASTAEDKYAWRGAVCVEEFDGTPDTRKRVNRLPLGAAALAGTSYPLDRERVARTLGMVDEAGNACVSQNSLDAVSDRDFAMEFLAFASITMVHVSRLAEELVLFK